MKSKSFFEENGFVVFNDAFPIDLCNYLVKHMFDLYQQNKLVKDEQCPLSDSVYSDPVFNKVLESYANIIGNELGLKLLPTYTYARIYRNGEVLKRHTDRESCEISATVTLGYDGKTPWRIYFDDKREFPVDLDIGEMAIYRGREVVHWRPRFKGEWQVQVFLHYVDADGPYKNFHKIEKNRKENKTQNQIGYLNNNFSIFKEKDNSFPGYTWIDSTRRSELMFTQEECEKIINISKDIYSVSASVGGTEESSEILKNIRSAQIYHVQSTEENRWIYDKIAGIVSIVNNEYFKYSVFGITHDMQLLEYRSDEEVVGHYDWHADAGTGEPATRKISLVVQLTNPKNYTGCNLVVNNYGTEITANREQGSVHLFPSYMVHKVTNIISGTRYALIVWIHGSEKFR